MTDIADRDRHGVRFVRGRPTTGFAVFGRIRESLDGIALDPGGVLYVRLATASPSPTTLAVRIATDPRHHGKAQTWTVDVEGSEVCSSTWADPGAGASRTVFVEPASVPRNCTLRIRAGWRNTFPFVVTSVRAFRVPAECGAATSRDPDYRMGLALLTSKGLGFALDRAELDRLRAMVPPSPYVTLQAAVLYNFCRKDMAEQLRAMRTYADLAYQARFPIRVAPQMHWAGIPAGVPDGAGGTFGDVPYQQVTWDDSDQYEDPGLKPLMGDRHDVRFGLSVPNIWSNTPWLTFNHPRLNQYRRSRLRQCVAAWRTVRERLARWGVPHLFPGELSTGEETVYWAKGVDDSGYTAINGGRPRSALLADFNPFVVADAAADRVILDPRNGLDRNERWWLHQNLARWQQTIVDWILEALPPEPIRIVGGRVGLADDLVRRNVYTEPYAMPVFPMRGVNPLRPGLEVGYVRDARSGGQYWSGSMMLPWLIKERERGRIALPNLECTGADDGQLVACLCAVYAHGGRYATLYNWHHRNNLPQLLNRFVKAVETPTAAAWPPGAADAAVQPAKERIYTAGPDAFGLNVITAYVSGGSEQGAVRIGIRSLDAKPEFSAVVTAPVSPAPQPGPQPVSVRLPTMFHQKPGERYAVSVHVSAPSAPAPVAAADGMAAVTVGSDIRLERWRSMAVADRQDAEDLIASVGRNDSPPRSNAHSTEWLATARRHMTGLRSRAAYAAAIKAEQLQFPCTFAVAEPGAELSPFPISVECPDERVQVTITALTRSSASLVVRATARHRVTIRYRGRATTVDLPIETPVTVDIEAAR